MTTQIGHSGKYIGTLLPSSPTDTFKGHENRFEQVLFELPLYLERRTIYQRIFF